MLGLKRLFNIRYEDIKPATVSEPDTAYAFYFECFTITVIDNWNDNNNNKKVNVHSLRSDVFKLNLDAF